MNLELEVEKLKKEVDKLDDRSFKTELILIIVFIIHIISHAVNGV